MSLKFSARRRIAVRARCTVVGLSRAIALTLIRCEKGYTPRQSDDWLESRAAAGAAWTTAPWPVDHKTPNPLMFREVSA